MKDYDRRIRQGGDDAIAAVSELMPRWISVEERLPEDDDPVLISWWGLLVGIGWCTAKKNWRDIGGKFPHTVTHWMPLPKPPRVT